MERIIFKEVKRVISKDTERGEIFRWFMQELNPEREKHRFPSLKFGRMGKLLEGIPTKDLYFIQSSMKDRDYVSAAKFFWWSLKPKEDENVNG